MDTQTGRGGLMARIEYMRQWTYLGRGQYRHTCGLVAVTATVAGVPRCDGEHKPPRFARARDMTGLAY